MTKTTAVARIGLVLSLGAGHLIIGSAGVAQEQAAPNLQSDNPLQAVSDAASTDIEMVQSGDTLEISVLGTPEVTRALSGEFRVDSRGFIRYPLVGRMQVSGLSTSDISSKISETMRDQLQMVGTPTVSLVTYAPVYLVGDVSQVGPVEFEPGMTIAELLMKAGGPLRQGPGADDNTSELELERFALQTETARLEAEMKGANFEPDQGHTGPEALAIVSNEVALFAARQQAKDENRESLRAQLARIDDEIATLKKSIDLHNEELAIANEQMKTQETLVEKGLSPRSSLLDMRRQVALTERASLEFGSSLFQTEQDRVEVERKIAEAETALRVQNAEQIRVKDLAIAVVDMKLSKVKPKADGNVSSNVFGIPLVFKLRRSNAETTVGENEQLQRGDIVRVVIGSEMELPKSEPALVTSKGG